MVIKAGLRTSVEIEGTREVGGGGREVMAMEGCFESRLARVRGELMVRSCGTSTDGAMLYMQVFQRFRDFVESGCGDA